MRSSCLNRMTSGSVQLGRLLRLTHFLLLKLIHVPEGVSLGQHCENISHHCIQCGNAFHELNFGVNSHNIHFHPNNSFCELILLSCQSSACKVFDKNTVAGKLRILFSLLVVNWFFQYWHETEHEIHSP